jgi:PAS domain S-box-containing protein
VTLLRKCLPFWCWRLLGLGILLLGPQLYALDPSRALFQYNFQTWSRKNGLPYNRIGAITQTDDGFLWLGTENGLARFDGYGFERFSIPNRDGWHNSRVACLRASSHGGVWFGLDAGTFGYFDGNSHFQSVAGEWVADQTYIKGIVEESDGSLWVAGISGLTGLPGGKTNQPIQHNQYGQLQSMYEDPQHRLWFGGSEKGLFYLESGQVKPFPDDGLLNANITALTTDGEGRLWVGTSVGLRCYDRSFKRNDLLPITTEVRTLLTDSHGAVWIGTSGAGLYRQYGGETSCLRQINGLTEDYISALFEDGEGNLWVGTRSGLTEISDVKFPTAATADGLLGEAVHGVYAAATGGVWCATSAGLFNYDYRTRSVTSLVIGTNTNPYFKRVLETRDGDLYTISGSREIRIYSHGECVAQYTNAFWPVAFAEDEQGVIAAVGSKLYRVNREEMTPYSLKDPTPQFYWIRNLYMGRDNSLLVCCVDGVYRLRNGEVEHWTTTNGMPDKDVICLAEDKAGTIWAGTTVGLARIKDHKASPVHFGPADCTINSITIDNQENLWISCNIGLIRAGRDSLNASADGHIANPTFKLFDGPDALRTIDLTEVDFVSAKTADGKIWLPSPLGLVEIDPAHISVNAVPPKVSIENIIANGISLTNGAALKIPPGRGELAFHYTAVSLSAPQAVRFRYKLDGYDRDWVDAGAQHSAMYANLEPGHYAFHVEACNVDGVWSSGGANFAIALPPAYYQTLWFKFAMAGGVVFMLSGFYGWRTRHLRHKEKQLQAANELLEQKIGERTREVAEQRNLLRTLIDNLPDAVFVKDTDCRVIINNKTHARYFGFENPSESVGKSDLDCLPREKAEEFRRDELALLQSGKPYDAEEPLVLKTGEKFWLRTSKVPLRNERGQIIGLAGINRDITERKKWETELESLHKQLLETSRNAGMAEVATSVLHNVGNVLNSVNISASIVDEQTRSANLDRLSKVISLLQENSSDLSGFLTEETKGKKIVPYLEALFDILKKEKKTIQSEVEALIKNVEHIKKIVAMQQSYARVAGVIEIIPPTELIEDSLRMHEAAFHRHSVKIVREYSTVPKIAVDRHKAIQILVNLLGNAKYACDVNPPGNRIIRVRLSMHGDTRIRIEVIDNGMGIVAENLTRIFAYGFTTRKTGHGFGLHSGALAAKEMGGSLHAESEGAGKGAAFIVELPLEYTPPTKTRPDDKKARSVRKDNSLVSI